MKLQIHCGINENEFTGIYKCKPQREMWNKLESTDEGTSRAKDTMISLVQGQFDNFKIEPNETIDELHIWFINIMKPLSVLEETFSNVKVNSKFLRSQLKDLEVKRPHLMKLMI